jgi:hypothetical protein
MREKFGKDSNMYNKYNVDVLFEKIHSLIIKTIISVESLLWNGIEMYIPSKKSGNCFELLGFDVLIDD